MGFVKPLIRPHLQCQRSSVGLGNLHCYEVPGGFPGGSGVKSLPEGNIGHAGSIPGPERSPRGGNGNPLQYSCLENPMDRGTWWAMCSPWGRKELHTTRHHTHTWSPQVLLLLFQGLVLWEPLVQTQKLKQWWVLILQADRVRVPERENPTWLSWQEKPFCDPSLATMFTLEQISVIKILEEQKNARTK